MKKQFQVVLVPPRIWQDISQQAFDALPEKVVPIAQSILGTLQNRHIGITPAIAAELAGLVSGSHNYNQNQGCWHHVIKRLLDESAEGRGTSGILFHAIPLYTILRLAAPIVQEASRRLGLCVLFCQDQIKSDTSRDDYIGYDWSLKDEIKRLATSKGDYFQTFWKERALTLSSYSRRAPVYGSSDTRLADIQPPALSLLMKLNPKLPPAKALAIHPRTVVDPMKHREIRRMREGGYSGLHITRRVEDMGDILMSEFLNPPAVLADRLINNGYLALRRQTKREQLRDVLVVGMLPEIGSPQPSIDFIKASWFDFIARFGFMLYRSRMMRSEFRWLEGDMFQRMKASSFLLRELRDIDIPVEGDLTPSFKKEFLTALGWLPNYLDTRGTFKRIPAFRANPNQLKVNGEKETEKERAWIYSAWRAQKESMAWEAIKDHQFTTYTPTIVGESEKNLDIGGYGYVHVMLFLPAPKRLEGDSATASRLGPLFSGLGFDSSGSAGNGHHIYSASITWVPEDIHATGSWAFDCKGTLRPKLFPGDTQGWSGHKIAGRLEEVWRHQLLKELQDGRV